MARSAGGGLSFVPLEFLSYFACLPQVWLRFLIRLGRRGVVTLILLFRSGRGGIFCNLLSVLLRRRWHGVPEED